MKITWFGHASFKVETENKVIYVDPFKGHYDNDADLILASHEHFDHSDKGNIESAKKANTIIITAMKNASKIGGQGVKPGDIKKLGNITLEVVEAYNINKQFHPKGLGVGFIIESEGKRLYFAGDTDKIPEMSGYKCDIAFLPVSGTYVMTAEEAAEAAKLIKPKVAVPMHYGSGIVGDVKDAEKFSEQLKGSKIQVKILKNMESFES